MSIDQVVPGDKWEFNAEVAESFIDMLDRSIVQYDVMRDLCFEVGRRYVQPNTDILDIGCSTGEALRPFVRKFGAHNRFHGVEVSEPMLAKAREVFSGYIKTGIVSIEKCDLRTDFPPVYASLILSVLTIQFTPIEYRQAILQRVYDRLIEGGAFVFVEKVLGNGSNIDKMFVERYLEIKRENGYTQEQIERKRLSLEGVLVPVTARWNEELLLQAGFKTVDCFWRYLNFAGWIAVK